MVRPQEWNAKKGEVRNARDNGRLASFLAEVKDNTTIVNGHGEKANIQDRVAQIKNEIENPHANPKVVII